jgi:hypothetical protein
VNRVLGINARIRLMRAFDAWPLDL